MSYLGLQTACMKASLAIANLSLYCTQSFFPLYELLQNQWGSLAGAHEMLDVMGGA